MLSLAEERGNVKVLNGSICALCWSFHQIWDLFLQHMATGCKCEQIDKYQKRNNVTRAGGRGDVWHDILHWPTMLYRPYTCSEVVVTANSWPRISRELLVWLKGRMGLTHPKLITGVFDPMQQHGVKRFLFNFLSACQVNHFKRQTTYAPMLINMWTM